MRLSRFLILSAVLSLAGLGWACQSTATDPAPDDAAYFPLETGKAAVFDVTETQYALGATPQTAVYQLKETVGPSYTTTAGQVAYRLFRYRRGTSAGVWQPDSVWSARRDANRAIRTENGNDYVKLVFPVVNGTTWNGNLYNNVGPNPYLMKLVNQPYSTADQNFGQSVTIQQQNDSTLVSLNKRVEIYARQVGLVYREKSSLFYCSSSPTCIGKAQIDYGTRQIFRLRSYGPDQ